MNVNVIDRIRGVYSCEFGEFREFPNVLGEGPPPRVAAFSGWTIAADERLRRREVDGTTYVDVDHEDRTWTYRLDPAWSYYPGDRVMFQQSEAFAVGVIPD